MKGSSPTKSERELWSRLAQLGCKASSFSAAALYWGKLMQTKKCNPCVNANRADLMRLTPGEIERVNDLEVEISQPMFRAKRFGALGIHGVIAWARDGRDRGDIEEEEAQCAGLFGCGL